MANTSWKTIAADLRTKIESGEWEVGFRLPSGDDIAAQWNVSRHTAHRAIHELQRAGVVVRQRRWGTVVSDPRGSKTGRIAFLVDQFAQSYNFPSGELIRGIQDAIGEQMNLVLAESKGDADMEMRQIKRFEAEVDGLLLYPTSNPRSTALIQRLVTEGFQVVILDRIPADLHADAVVSDNEGATLRALHALESRGHRRIGFFSFHKPDFSSVNERYHAYQLALAEVGIQDATNLTRWFARELDGQPQQFVQAVHDSLFTLLKQDEPITALFCVQDSIASAASEACDRIGIQIPDRLEIVTFNDWPPMMLRTPWNMHRIVQRGYDIGQAAGNLLLERIQDPEGEPKTIRVDADFFVADAGIMPI